MPLRTSELSMIEVAGHSVTSGVEYSIIIFSSPQMTSQGNGLIVLSAGKSYLPTSGIRRKKESDLFFIFHTELGSGSIPQETLVSHHAVEPAPVNFSGKR
jgi:hypothetical protein